MADPISKRLRDLAQLFFKLGVIGFGGPAVHIALMEDEVVKKRKWLTHGQFLDLLGATNLIPGPNSTEMAIHIGYESAGIQGLIVAGSCFIFPAVLITGILAWVYVQYGNLPQFSPILYGIKPVVFAVILEALWRLGKKAIKSWELAIIAGAIALFLFGGLNEVAALILGGILGMIGLGFSRRIKSPANRNLMSIWLGLAGSQLVSPVAFAATASQISLWKLGLFFLKVGSVLFGSGYVLIAFLEGGLVQDYEWLTQQQLLDAIAIGQFTPGPVLSTATFIGYIIAGVPGAIVATLGIFLPSFLFVAISNPLIPRLRSSQWASAFLDSVNSGSVALMGVVTLQLARGTFVDWGAGLIFLWAVIGKFLIRANSAWLILFGAFWGLLFSRIISIN